jgi:AraC-like DNA-binding protein
MKEPAYPHRPDFLPIVPFAGGPRDRLGAVPRAKGGISRAACAQARRAGIPLPALLRAANLTLQLIREPHAPLAARDQLTLLNLVADATRDDLLGLHLAQRAELRELGLLYYVLASSQTLIEALQRAVRYSTLVNEGVIQRCTVGRNINITLDYTGISRHADRHQAECWMALIVRILRQLSGRRIAAQRVQFVHYRSSEPRELSAYFGGSVEFGSDVDRISFAKGIGNTAVVGADPYLNKLLAHYCEEALAHRFQGRESFRSRVENAVVPLLPHAECSARAMARRLGFSQRTFARHLTAEGVSFSALLADLRLDLANRYLAEPGTSVSQIAWLLGYQQVSAFSKAYRRWTGTSPRATRHTTKWSKGL